MAKLFRTFGVISFFLFSALLSSCASQPKVDGPNAISERFFGEYLKLHPLFASSIGDHRYDDQMTFEEDPALRAKDIELLERTLQDLNALGDCSQIAFSESEKITCATLKSDLTAELQLQKSSLSYLMPINQFRSFFMDFAELASGESYVTLKTEDELKNFLSRMKRFPSYVDFSIQNMKEGMKLGVTTPKILVQKAIRQMEDLVKDQGPKSIFFKPIVDLKNAKLKEEYETVVRTEIFPSYVRLLNFVKKDYVKKTRSTHGISRVPGGDTYYRALIRTHTTLSLSPDEIHQIGLKEVSRIDRQFEEARIALGFKGSMKSFFKSFQSGQKFYPFQSEQEVMNRYQEIHQKIVSKVPQFFGLTPKTPFEIKQVPAFKAASASEAYQNGTPDGKRPGIFWVPIPDPKKYPVKEMESLFLHEAIPGHHFQISIQSEQDLPRYRKFFGNNAYVEGWALYTESLGRDLGLYQDPYQWIGRLTNEMHRAIRLVVDTGIHAKGWSREKAIQYSLEHEPGDLNGVVSEIERYMAIPGQALSYKLGEIKIRELKERAKRSLGQKFSDREFHDRVLAPGAVPLNVLDTLIEAWIQEKLK